MEIKELYNLIDTIIKANKKARANNDYLTLMLNAEALLEYMPALINHSVDQESEYRKFEASLSNKSDDTGKRLTGSYCDTQAKATDSYKEWQRSKHFIELMYEMVNIAKKLASSVDKQLNASSNNEYPK